MATSCRARLSNWEAIVVAVSGGHPRRMRICASTAGSNSSEARPSTGSGAGPADAVRSSLSSRWRVASGDAPAAGSSGRLTSLDAAGGNDGDTVDIDAHGGLAGFTGGAGGDGGITDFAEDIVAFHELAEGGVLVIEELGIAQEDEE